MERIKIFCLILIFGTPACADPEGRSERVGPGTAWAMAAEMTQWPACATTKSPWASKTLWLNAAVAIGLLAEANIEMLKGVLPDNKYALIAFGLPIANMLLRWYTSKGLSFKPQMPVETQEQK
jgi:hypothetical protein